MLLIMAVSLFSVVYLFVINESLDPSDHPPSAHIVGTTEAKTIQLENRGQEPLSSDTEIVLTIAGKQMNMTVAPYLEDKNGDGLWNFGEKLVFDQSDLGIDIIGLQVKATVIDRVSDSVVMTGTIQEGEVYEYPYVLVKDATNIESDRAKLWMDYNFRSYSGSLRFAYKEAGGSWNFTGWLIGQSGEGSYGQMVTGLVPETVYFFKAQLNYSSQTLENGIKSFATLGVIVGMWHFDTGSGTDAIDSSGRDNHGKLYNGPQWATGVNGTALSYDGIDDYVRVSDNPSLDITDKLTIEAWMKPLEHSEGYYGNVQGSIDRSSFGILDIYDPDIIHISGNLYAVACRGDHHDGFLITFKIADDGHIDYTIIDSFEFYTGDCYEPNIIHIDGSIYAIAFRRPNWAYVRTVEIFNSGKINRTIKDTLLVGTTYRESNIFHINGTVYAIGYTGTGNDGYLTTVDIANDGESMSIIDTKIFHMAITGYSEEIDLIHVDGIVYAIAYRNPDDDGELRTINITNDGQISAPYHQSPGNPGSGDYYLDKLLFDPNDGYEPDITHIGGNIYAICYGGFKNAGTIRTVKIYNDGTIKEDIIDALEFDGGPGGCGREPSIIHINGDIYAISYRGPGNDGWLKTVEIASDGMINNSVVDSYEFDGSNCWHPGFLHIDGNIYAIVYSGYYNDGLLKTVQISNDGTISKPVIDYSELGIFDLLQPDMIKISDNICAMAFRGFSGDGYLRTFEIYNDGKINDTIIDTFRFHKGWVEGPKLINISGDVYAIAYSNDSGTWHGFLKTVKITNTGNITEIASLEFETNNCREPDIVHVNGNVYAIAYRGLGDDGYVKTVNILSNGQILPIAMASATKKFYDPYAHYPDIFHCTGDVYAIAFQGKNLDGYLRTVKIANDGTVTTSGMDILEFEYYYCVWPEIINVTGNIYAIAYTASSNDGFVKTVKIDSNGTIVGGVIESLEFDNYHGYRPDIIHIKDRVFAIAYSRYYQDGYLRTLRIGENGEITNSVDSNYRFDSSVYYWAKCRIIHINGSIFAIAYRSPYSDGFVRTVKIQYTPSVGYIVARSDAYRINANSTTVFAKIYFQSGGYKQLTAPISSGFNYVVLTYDKKAGSNQMKLYVDTVPKSQTTYTDKIRTNSNPLYFGGLNEVVDEISLWRTALTPSEINQHYNEYTATAAAI